jgi:hypothetical protein
MAKIFLISRDRSDTANSFIESLETDQQPVYPHLTSEPSPKNLLLIWASFLRIQPDLVYFIFDNEKLNWMEKALVETLGVLPNQPMAVSFLGFLSPKKSKILRTLLKRADLVTLSSRQNLADLRGISSESKRQLRTLLAPLPSLENLDVEVDHKSEEVLTAIGSKKIWICPWDSEFIKKNSGFFESTAKDKTWIFLGDRSEWGFHQHTEFQELFSHWVHKPLWSSHLNKAETLKLLKESEVLLLAGMQISPSLFVNLASLSAIAGTFVILDTHQIELMSGLWAVGENCSLLDRDQYVQQLENRWISGALVPTQIKKRVRTPALVLDQSLNELNRWITKALSDRKLA